MAMPSSLNLLPAAIAHSSSVGRRQVSPVFRESHSRTLASCQLTWTAGRSAATISRGRARGRPRRRRSVGSRMNSPDAHDRERPRKADPHQRRCGLFAGAREVAVDAVGNRTAMQFDEA